MNDFEKRLRAELRQAQVSIPTELDARIRRTAQTQIQGPRRIRKLWPIAIAAAAALLIFAFWPTPDRFNEERSLDIVDAYRLALRLDAGAIKPEAIELHSARDFNGDGQIDRKDIAAIITEAVKLERKPS